MTAALLWFRRDLRLSDNPALAAAVASGLPIVPVYVLDESTAGVRALGGAQRWWLHHALAALDAALQARGLRLVLRRGPAAAVIAALAAETGAELVVWNRCYDAPSIRRDEAIKAALKRDGRRAESFNASLLFEPWTVQTGAGGPFQVFTPFWRALQARPVPPVAPDAPDHARAPGQWPAGDRLADWALLPTRPDWSGGLRATWTPGEAGAARQLRQFLADGLAAYATDRNRPDRPHTSRLSPYLHWGEIGPRQVWHAVQHAAAAGSQLESPAASYLRELGWREFAHHLLFHFPQITDSPLRREFAEFPWHAAPDRLRAWQLGRTGYPIVDAGLRELWYSGWMHNRVRMITASFLVKHLLQPWQAGEAWFWDTLVDADHANNPVSWQWVAGSGADAAPYFRVFNPVLQGEKFDPDGIYVRRWVPELAALPADWIHKPWEAPAGVLQAAGVRLDETYPAPLVEHKAARARALEAFASLKRGAA